MAKYDDVKMAELVKAEETKDALVLTFQGGKQITIKTAGDALVSDVS